MLDKFLVMLGIKGQNVVLAQMDKVRKKGGDLSKKNIVKMTPAQNDWNTYIAKAKKDQKSLINLKYDQEQRNLREDLKNKNISKKDYAAASEAIETNRKTELREEQFGKYVGKFGQSADRFANAAATLNPTSLIQSIASTMPFLGAIAMAAGGALESAKTSTAGAYELSKRNTAIKFYGGEQIRGKYSKGQGALSNSEHAMFVGAVSSSMGKIQKPLADAINNLINKKDTRALARAAGGDWESTGTNKGWIASQIMSGTEGLPPSIKQKISAAMLKNFGGEIQETSKEQRERQGNAAYYENSQENQTMRLADTAATATFVDASGKVVNSMRAMNDALNDMQNAMVKGAGKMVTAIAFITDAAMNSKNLEAAKHPTQVGFEKFVKMIK